MAVLISGNTEDASAASVAVSFAQLKKRLARKAELQQSSVPFLLGDCFCLLVIPVFIASSVFHKEGTQSRRCPCFRCFKGLLFFEALVLKFKRHGIIPPIIAPLEGHGVSCAFRYLDRVSGGFR